MTGHPEWDRVVIEQFFKLKRDLPEMLEKNNLDIQNILSKDNLDPEIRKILEIQSLIISAVVVLYQNDRMNII